MTAAVAFYSKIQSPALTQTGIRNKFFSRTFKLTNSTAQVTIVSSYKFPEGVKLGELSTTVTTGKLHFPRYPLLCQWCNALYNETCLVNVLCRRLRANEMQSNKISWNNQDDRPETWNPFGSHGQFAEKCLYFCR